MGRDTLPGFEPGALPPTTRYQRFAYDAGLSRRALLKSAILCLTGVGIVAAWKAADAKESGAQEAVNFLIRFAISFAAAFAIYIACCSTGIIEYSGPFSRATLGVAAALLVQHIGAETIILFGVPVLGIPWLIGLLVFLGLASDLLELDITEAALYAIFVLGARLILKFAFFDHMFQAT
jgi:hypothetical protein